MSETPSATKDAKPRDPETDQTDGAEAEEVRERRALQIEALLLTTDKPLTVAKLAELLAAPSVNPPPTVAATFKKSRRS